MIVTLSVIVELSKIKIEKYLLDIELWELLVILREGWWGSYFFEVRGKEGRDILGIRKRYREKEKYGMFCKCLGVWLC